MWTLLHSLEYITIFFIGRPRPTAGSYPIALTEYCNMAWRGAARRGALPPITKPNLEGYTRPDMSAHVFTWRIDSLVYIRASYKLGGMLLFSNADQRRRPIVARGNTLSPRRYGPPFNRLPGIPLPFFFLPPRESDRRVIDSRICPPVAAISFDPWKKSRSEKTLRRACFKNWSITAFCCLRRIDLSLAKS